MACPEEEFCWELAWEVEWPTAWPGYVDIPTSDPEED